MAIIQKNKNIIMRSGNFISSFDGLKTGEKIKLWKKKYSSKLRGFNSAKVIRDLRSGKLK